MKEKTRRKNVWLMIFLVFIMIGTSFSFVFYSSNPVSEKVKYNGISYTFVPKDNVWVAKISGRTAVFSFKPQDFMETNMSGDIDTMLRDRFEIDSTSDWNSTFKEHIALAQHQMGLTLEAYNVFLRKGFISNNTFNIPIITCNDATSNVPVIYFKPGNSTRIFRNDNCILAEAKSGPDFLKLKDKLLYTALGMK